jgi:NAD(P)-dependent dehydrogenase (short-subunit alcohol dehydrogenase family)
MTANKRALVTGGNRGIGLAISQGLIDPLSDIA